MLAVKTISWPPLHRTRHAPRDGSFRSVLVTLRVTAAQAAIVEIPEFQGNVALVKTDVFWDVEAQKVFDKGWRQHPDEWKKVGSNFPFHYLGSARTMLGIGGAFGEAMIALEGKKQTARQRNPAVPLGRLSAG